MLIDYILYPSPESIFQKFDDVKMDTINIISAKFPSISCRTTILVEWKNSLHVYFAASLYRKNHTVPILKNFIRNSYAYMQ